MYISLLERSKIQAEVFLSCIFPHPFDQLGYVEIRLLDDQNQSCQYQRWFRSIDEILNDWDEFIEMADACKLGIAFSPAIRKRKSGKKKDVHGTWCLWNDQNLENGDQHDCLQRLRQDDLSMIVVNSGYCAHGYLLLDEFCDDIEKIERANSLLKHRLGGDNVQDAGRVMRVPGTLNYKDYDCPQPCRLVELTSQQHIIDKVIESHERQGYVSTS